jgi:hypothetical protein
MDGSVDKMADTKVQARTKRIIRSNLDLLRPVVRVATLLNNHPIIEIATPMVLAATE